MSIENSAAGRDTARKNVAVILAGGVGSRSGLDIPKQFYLFAGKTVLQHSVDAFQNSPDIDEIAIVAAPEFHEEIRSLCRSAGKLKKILANGKERCHSALSAVRAYENEKGVNLFIHDAVRPLVSARIIHECAEALKRSPAACTAIPSADTIVEADKGLIVGVPARSRLWRNQTPQCFHWEVLNQAFKKGLADPAFTATDECKIVRTYCPEIDILIVQGEESNVKLTYNEDIHLISRLFQLHCKASECEDLSLSLLKGKTIAVFDENQIIGEAAVKKALACGAEAHWFKCGALARPEEIKKALASIGKPIDGVLVFSYNELQSDISYVKEAYPYLKASKGMFLFCLPPTDIPGKKKYGLSAACKAALISLALSLADEWREEGIKINCISAEIPSPLISDIENFVEAALKMLLGSFSGRILNIKEEL